jgi:WD40 repeat protein/Flp pilus assembly protein TadD
MIAAQLGYTHRLDLALRDANQKLVRQYVSNGLKSLDDNDNLSALPWFARALQLDERDPHKARVHRLRIKSVLASCPRLVDFKRPSVPFDPVVTSNDGRWIVGLNNADVWIHDTANPSRAAGPLVHGAAVKRVALSPDGLQLATACADGTARVWSTVTGAPVTSPLAHRDEVNDASFSPDGRFLLTAVGGSSRGAIADVVLWTIATAQTAMSFVGHVDDVYTARFSADGRCIVTASYDRTARVWDTATGRQLGPALRHARPVTCAEFDPAGLHVVTISGEEVRLWDPTTGAPTTPPLLHRGPVYRVAFATDGIRLATEAYDRKVRVWDTTTGRPIGSAIPEKSDSAIAFRADGRQLEMTGAKGDRAARLWDAASAAPPALVLPHEDNVVCALYSSDGERVLTASYDQSWRIWSANDGRPLISPVRQEGLLESASFSPDDRFVLTAGRGGAAQVWESATGRPVSAPMKHDNWIKRAAFGPDGRSVVTASWDGTARVWEAATGNPLTGPLKHGTAVLDAAFHPGGKHVATASSDGTALLWVLATQRPALQPLEHGDWVLHVAFSPDGRRLLTASNDRKARLWDVATGTLATTPLGHDGAVLHAAFSTDGTRVVTGSADRTARVWDAATGAPLTPPLQHKDRVNHVVFDREGLYVLSASGGPDSIAASEVRMWDAATGESVLFPLKHGDAVNTVAYSRDGQHILSAGYDRQARIWSVTTEDHPVPIILSLAELLAGSRVDETGGLIQLGSDTLLGIWERVRIRYPELFSCPVEDVVAWHAQEAELALERKNWVGAVLHLSRVVAARPDSPDLLFRRAQAHAELDHWREAQRDLSDAIRHEAARPLAWYHLALVHLAQGNLEGYRRNYAQMMTSFAGSSDAETDNLLAWTCAMITSTESLRLEAVGRARQAVTQKPRDFLYLETLGAALYRAGDHEAAVRTLEEAIAIRDGEGTFSALLFLALAQARLGRVKAARSHIDAADRWWEEETGPRAGRSASPISVNWRDRVVFKSLRREVSALLDTNHSSAPLPRENLAPAPL